MYHHNKDSRVGNPSKNRCFRKLKAQRDVRIIHEKFWNVSSKHLFLVEIIYFYTSEKKEEMNLNNKMIQFSLRD